MDRLKAFQFVIYLLTLAIVARLFYWQFLSPVSSDDSLSQEIKISAQRGEIFTADNFPLVTNQEAFVLYAKPKEIKTDAGDLGSKLAPLLISEKYSTSEAKLTDSEEDNKRKETEAKETELVNKISQKNLFWV